MRYTNSRPSVLNQVLMSSFNSLVVIGFVIVGLGLLASNVVDIASVREGYDLLNNGAM
jgi:hypothetical protein